jgi:hypothetical protein
MAQKAAPKKLNNQIYALAVAPVFKVGVNYFKTWGM